MFTVIIAEKSFLQIFKSYDIFLKPLIDESMLGFCEWNPAGGTIEEMVPELSDKIEYQENWRALIINNANVTKRNPFDYVEYNDASFKKSVSDLSFRESCEKKAEIYSRASENPLAKLTGAFYGKSDQGHTQRDIDDISDIVDNSGSLIRYMLQSYMQSADMPKIAAYTERYRKELLAKYIDEDNRETLMRHVRTGNVDGIIELIGEEKAVAFMEFLSNCDPAFSDVKYAECSIEGAIRTKFLKELYSKYVFNDRLPYDVMCVSARSYDSFFLDQPSEEEDLSIKAFTQFANYNLFNDNLKFILFDVLPARHKQYGFSMLKYLMFIVLLAQNKAPAGAIRTDKMHLGSIEFDRDRFKDACESYIDKLTVTKIHVKELQQEKQSKKMTVDNETVERELESNVSVPVNPKITTKYDELFAEYKWIGLSSDCPEPEEMKWSGIFKRIKKDFLRFLREPRRALERAVTDDFSELRKFSDERAAYLNKFQRDDIAIHAKDEERAMINTNIRSIYDTNRYTSELDKADKAVKIAMAKRMSKMKTVLTAIIPLLVFACSFIPLIVGNTNTSLSTILSVAFSAGSIFLLALCAFIYLFVLKRKMVKEIKKFNVSVQSLLSEISSSLGSYSTFLSHACNVMRDTSLLADAAESEEIKSDTYHYHILMIDRNIESARALFSQFVDNPAATREIQNVAPYEFNFDALKNYSYTMQLTGHESLIEFVQPGNEIRIPVDFIKSLTLQKEELYD